MARAVSAALAAAAVGIFAAAVWAEGVGEFRIEALEVRSTRDLVEVCTLAEPHPEYEAARGFCLGYVQGGKHYHDAATGPERPPIVCPAPSVTAGQAVDVFLAYMATNPQLSDEPAMEAFFQAVAARWPCGKEAR